MKSIKFLPLIAALALGSALSPQRADAAIYIDADGDILSPELLIEVTSGSILTLKGIFSASEPPPVPFDIVGMGLSYSGTATALPTGGPTGVAAGTLVASTPLALDLVSGDPVLPDGPLVPVLPPGPELVDSAGYSDGISSYFGGIGLMPGLGIPYDLMEWEFSITGAVGTSVSFMPEPGLIGVDIVPSGAGIDFLADSDSRLGFAPGPVSGITVMIVPEPSATMLLGLGGMLLFVFRRRR